MLIRILFFPLRSGDGRNKELTDFAALAINILPFVDMFADGKLDIFASQNRYIALRFDMI